MAKITEKQIIIQKAAENITEEMNQIMAVVMEYYHIRHLSTTFNRPIPLTIQTCYW